MNLEDMPVVTAEQVMRFRTEAIGQRNALAAQVEGMREALDELYNYAAGFNVSGVYLSDETEGERLLCMAAEALITPCAASLAQHDAELLERVAAIFRKGGAALPVDPQGSIESSVNTGLSIALAVVENEIKRIRAEAGGDGV